MKKFTRTGAIAGAAIAVTSVGAVAGVANGQSSDTTTAPKGPERQAQIAVQQAAELKLQAQDFGAVAEKAATFRTAVGTVTETHFTKNGKTIRICASTIYAAGGGAQTCRTGEKLTEPLIIVDRSGTADTVSVAGLAPAGATSDVAITKETGAISARGVAAQRAAAPSESAAIGTIASQSDADAITYRSPATGAKRTYSLDGTVAALDAG